MPIFEVAWHGGGVHDAWIKVSTIVYVNTVGSIESQPQPIKDEVQQCTCTRKAKGKPIE